MKVCIVGSGFVGLVTGVYFAKLGHEVICVDNDPEKVKQIKQGIPHFYEPLLTDRLLEVLNSNFEITCDLKKSLNYCDFIFLCVGTPSLKSGAIDLSYLKVVSDEIASSIRNSNKFKTIIVKSTVVPGTCRKILIKNIEALSGKENSKDFAVVMNPEFLREGRAVEDAFNPDRVIVGSDSRKAGNEVLELYRNVKRELKFHLNLESAELSKYLSNMFFANLISFSNEFSRICQSVPNAEVDKLFDSLFKDRRFGSPSGEFENKNGSITDYLSPGVGFGGSCFPKDINAIINYSKEQKVETPILNAVKKVNDTQTNKLVDLFLHKYGVSKVGILGLSFKPDTDDTRDSRSIEIIRILNNKGINVVAHDPKVRHLPKDCVCDIITNLEDVITRCDGIIIATSWKEYLGENLISLLLKKQVPVLDCRLILMRYKDQFKHYTGPGIN